MTLQLDIEKKILTNKKDELRELLFEFVSDVDENKVAIKTIKDKLLQESRELVLDEMENE